MRCELIERCRNHLQDTDLSTGQYGASIYGLDVNTITGMRTVPRFTPCLLQIPACVLTFDYAARRPSSTAERGDYPLRRYYHQGATR